jgi:hypothetical protein
MAHAGHSYSTERRVERLVLPSEFQGLDDLKGYLKYGNDIVKFTLPIMPKITRAPGFVPRASQPIEKKPLPDLETILGQQKKLAEEKKASSAKPAAVVKPIRSE